MSPEVAALLVLALLSEGCASFSTKPVLLPVMEPPPDSYPCWEWIYRGPHGRYMECLVASLGKVPATYLG